MKPPRVVWQPDGRGWRRVRARVPASTRSGHASERLPRPPSFRFTAGGVEDVPPARDAGAVEALGAQLAREVAREVVDRFGGWAAAAALALFVLSRRSRKGTR